jgi:hypothetical protein
MGKGGNSRIFICLKGDSGIQERENKQNET